MKSLPASLLLLLATGCGDADEAAPQVLDQMAAGDGERIECMTGSHRGFERACIVERLEGQAGATLIIRHPDGGFRRLLVTKDGRGVVAADGADQAVVTVVAGNLIDVQLGGDRYRLPATIAGRR